MLIRKFFGLELLLMAAKAPRAPRLVSQITCEPTRCVNALLLTINCTFARFPDRQTLAVQRELSIYN